MPNAVVINSGVPNENTRHLLKRVNADVLNQQPDLVIIMIGANDTIESTDLVPLDEYRENLTALVKSIQHAGSLIMLLTLPFCYEPYLYTRHNPQAYGPHSANNRISEVNQFIRDLGTNNNCHVIDVNFYFEKLGAIGENEMSLVMNVTNSNSTDGVHPTAEGYRLIASLIHQYMILKNLSFEKIVCFGDSITFGAKVEGEGTNEGLSYPAQLQTLLA